MSIVPSDAGSREAMTGAELALRLLAAFRGLVDELHDRPAAEGHPAARPIHGFALQAIGPQGATAAELGVRLGVSKQAAGKTIDGLEDILVDREVTAVIEEQQRWVRERFPDTDPQHLFLQRTGNRPGAKPYPAGPYNRMLREFSALVAITDSKARPVRLSHTHRFRHTKLTKLAELGLPVHVLQRYAGHASPTMSMHYVANREEHAEQAFLATVKLKADGTQVMFSREDHDSLHLFDRADRILPHGWCLLPPLQTCDKGNACLTCSVFATDETHQQALQRQLAETTELIERSTAAFHDRHGRPMPEDNVWLAQRRAEQTALTRLLATMRDNPRRAIQGGGCSTSSGTGSAAGSPQGPIPLTLEPPRHRRTQP